MTTTSDTTPPLPFPLRHLFLLCFSTALFTFYLKMPLSKPGGEDPVPAMGAYGPLAAYAIAGLVALIFGGRWGLSLARYNEVRASLGRFVHGAIGFAVAVATLTAGDYAMDGLIVLLAGKEFAKAFGVAWPGLLYLIPWLLACIWQLGSIPVDPEVVSNQ